MAGSDRPRKGGSPNRGPAAAQDNRAALLAAARVVFAAQGYDAPLSAIAKAAGVGQGVLYRHFPDRLSLAKAVFQENFACYDALVAHPDGDTLATLWRTVCRDMVRSAAFMEMTVEARRTDRFPDDVAHFERVVAAALPPALAAGTVAPDLTVEEVLLAVRMVYGIVVTDVGTDEEALLRTLERALPRLAGR